MISNFESCESDAMACDNTTAKHWKAEKLPKAVSMSVKFNTYSHGEIYSENWRKN